MLNVEQTLLSQYANSPRLRMILDGFNQAIDPSALIDHWYDTVWNLNTATGWGLDVWGRIVGVGRVIKVAPQEYFGFAQASPTARTFSEGLFYSGQTTTQNFALEDTAFRQLIKAKALANITSGSIADINAIVMSLFGDKGLAYVREGTLSMTVVLAFTPSPVDLSILTSGVIPRPSGIAITYSTPG